MDVNITDKLQFSSDNWIIFTQKQIKQTPDEEKKRQTEAGSGRCEKHPTFTPDFTVVLLVQRDNISCESFILFSQDGFWCWHTHTHTHTHTRVSSMHMKVTCNFYMSVVIFPRQTESKRRWRTGKWMEGRNDGGRRRQWQESETPGEEEEEEVTGRRAANDCDY